MNKLMGFFELREMNLPSIPWRQYTGSEELDDRYLWTIRSAVYRGDDMNLPRSVGKNAEESKKFADQLLSRMRDHGIVVFYPYFIAKKSGTLEVRRDTVVVEAVKDDLWNLVTYSDREVTIVMKEGGETQIHGNQEFLCEDELEQLVRFVPEVRRIFRDSLLQGEAALLEWSYALTCDTNKAPVGDKYLVFYEARTVK